MSKCYDSECEELADHFLREERPKSMSETEYKRHRAELAQEIQDVVEMFCEYDYEWTNAKNQIPEGAGEPKQ